MPCVVQDCKRWLRNHGATTNAEIAYYTDSIRALFLSASSPAYGQELLSYVTTWSQPFTKFFLDTIHPEISHMGATTLWRRAGHNEPIRKLQLHTEEPAAVEGSASGWNGARAVPVGRDVQHSVA